MKTDMLFTKESDNNRQSSRIVKLSTKLHGHVLLCADNWNLHIQVHHPDVTLKMVRAILEEPDYIYKPTKYSKKSSKELYYQKRFGNKEYRVVIGPNNKNKRNIISVYPMIKPTAYDYSKIYCCYSRDKCLVDDWLSFQSRFDGE